MLPLIQPQQDWKRILRTNFTRWEALADFLELDNHQRSCIVSRPHFPLNLPMRLAGKIEKGTLDDPILKQFLPVQEELAPMPGFIGDPVKDSAFRKAPKLLHKYQGRALLVCTSACAMHCRFCFRQNFDYATQDKTFEEELELIAQDASLHEIILSGGDPLSLSDDTLSSLLDTLNDMPHIRRLRIHSRFPIGIPERVDDNFLAMMEKCRAQVWFVIHANHPREVDADVVEAMRSLQKIGVSILNQSVLLKGVNDDLATLLHLCEQLADAGILPYYLHQLDRVQGAAHFEVSEEEGLRLVKELAKHLPGYAVPSYVREIAGEPSKTLIASPNPCQ